MSDQPKTMTVPTTTFAFGDKRYRVLYGPENEQHERPIVGMVDEVMVGPLEDMLEYADAHMTDDDRKSQRSTP